MQIIHRTAHATTFLLALTLGGCDVDDIDAAPESLALDDDAPQQRLALDGEESEDPSLLPEKLRVDLSAPLPDPAAVSCPGWPTGDWCMTQCSNGGWYTVGHWTAISYGHCGSAGASFCGYYGLGQTGACWGFP